MPVFLFVCFFPKGTSFLISELKITPRVLGTGEKHVICCLKKKSVLKCCSFNTNFISYRYQ